MTREIFAIAALLLTPEGLLAADGAPGTLTGGLQLWAGLAIVTAVILLLYAAAKRWLRWPAGGRSGIIRIRETRALGPKKALFLVQVRDRELLLGVTGEAIALLCDMPLPADEVEKEPFERTLSKRMKESP
jgi:flagellar protein FliO/FliZ